MQLKTHFKLTEVVSAILHISREVANLRGVDAAQVMAVTLRVLEEETGLPGTAFLPALPASTTQEDDPGERLNVVAEKTLKFIEAAGEPGVSRRDVAAGCWAFRGLSNEDRDDLIDHFIKDGIVVLKRTPSGRGTALVHARFAGHR
jgi:hypothetical protein